MMDHFYEVALHKMAVFVVKFLYRRGHCVLRYWVSIVMLLFIRN